MLIAAQGDPKTSPFLCKVVFDLKSIPGLSYDCININSVCLPSAKFIGIKHDRSAIILENFKPTKVSLTLKH